jgi:hypothetical protein
MMVTMAQDNRRRLKAIQRDAVVAAGGYEAEVINASDAMDGLIDRNIRDEIERDEFMAKQVRRLRPGHARTQPPLPPPRTHIHLTRARARVWRGRAEEGCRVRPGRPAAGGAA